MLPTHGPGAGQAPRPAALMIGIFAAGAVITAAVAYLGVVGDLGWGVPGTEHRALAAPPPLTSCLGHDRFGSFHFLFVAGLKGSFTFNGSSPGPCVAVVVGSQISVTLHVDPGASGPDSWAVIPADGPASSPPVFPGAGWTNATASMGIAPGSCANFTFTAGSTGTYRYASQVGNHAAVGMFGGFNVTASSATGAVMTAEPARDAGAVGTVGADRFAVLLGVPR